MFMGGKIKKSGYGRSIPNWKILNKNFQKNNFWHVFVTYMKESSQKT